MRFRTKIILIYTVFVLVAAAIIGIIYYNMNVSQYKEREYKSMESTAILLTQQFEDTIQSMDLVYNYVLTDSDAIDALVTLAQMDQESDTESVFFSTASGIMRSKLNVEFIMSNYNRVIIFNDNGSVISSNNYSNMKINPNVTIDDIEWIDKAKNRKSQPVLIGKHEDDWTRKSPGEEVFSLVKEVQGMSMGYIEVQKSTSELSKLMQFPKEEMEVILITDDDEIIYSSKGDEYNHFYIQVKNNMEEKMEEITNTISGHDEVVAANYSPSTETTLLLMQDTEVITAEEAYILPMTFMVASIFALISVTFVIIISIRLTSPIRKLSLLMENTSFENMKEEIPFEKSNDEIAVLNQSYQNVLRRLNDAMIKEKRMSYLQLQAQFDLLQTQVNPHFLYNVLNVISNRGILSDDEVICDICGSLAQMLRYATNTKERYACIREEAEYLDQYFYLLKSRYKDKLEYRINIDESIHEQMIPKITLQQIVENSIAHGYENSVDTMLIQVSGWSYKGRWHVRIRDNGEGFSDGKIEKLKEEMKKMKKRLSEEVDSVEMEIGGMGLINTYARLYISYADTLQFEMKNTSYGAEVIISAAMEGHTD